MNASRAVLDLFQDVGVVDVVLDGVGYRVVAGHWQSVAWGLRLCLVLSVDLLHYLLPELL
jgi:hypothetical protein